jgi:hypothetical protein
MQLEKKEIFLYNQTNSDKHMLVCRRKKDMSKKITAFARIVKVILLRRH